MQIIYLSFNYKLYALFPSVNNQIIICAVMPHVNFEIKYYFNKN